MHLKDFILVLKNFLTESGLSMNELGRKTGVPQSQISRWNNGQGKRFTKNSKKILDYIKKHNQSMEYEVPDDILKLINEMTYGDRERQKKLQNILINLSEIWE